MEGMFQGVCVCVCACVRACVCVFGVCLHVRDTPRPIPQLGTYAGRNWMCAIIRTYFKMS